MPSYEEVEKRIIAFIVNADNDEQLRMNVIEWYKDFNNVYYSRMVEIVEIIKNSKCALYPNSEEAKEIIKYGNEFYNFANNEDLGFKGEGLMRSLYYIMCNFMDTNGENMSQIKFLWSGIGDWTY